MGRRPSPLPTRAEVLAKLEAAGVSEAQVEAALQALALKGGMRSASALPRKLRDRRKHVDALSARITALRSAIVSTDEHPLERRLAAAYDRLEADVDALVDAVGDLEFGEKAAGRVQGLPLGAASVSDLALRLRRMTDDALTYREFCVLMLTAGPKGRGYLPDHADHWVTGQLEPDRVDKLAEQYRKQVSRRKAKAPVVVLEAPAVDLPDGNRRRRRRGDPG